MAIPESPATLYRRFLSAKLSRLVWYPISCDTSSVATDQSSQHLSFSGGALIGCEGVGDVFLTWAQDRGEYCLTLSSIPEAGWLRGALDRVQCRWDGAWAHAQNAEITRVRLYSMADDSLQRLVAVEHELLGDGRTCTVWIGSGGEDWIGDGTDLWVGIDNAPPNISALTLQSIVESNGTD